MNREEKMINNINNDQPIRPHREHDQIPQPDGQVVPVLGSLCRFCNSARRPLLNLHVTRCPACKKRHCWGWDDLPPDPFGPVWAPARCEGAAGRQVLVGVKRNGRNRNILIRYQADLAAWLTEQGLAW